MYILVLLIHITVCFFMIFIVLVQSGKGAELGAAFGGSSQTLFGARGAATLFSKLTTIAAVVFMITSLTLAVMTSKGASVVKQSPAATQSRKSIPQPQEAKPSPQSIPAAPASPLKK